MTALPPNPFITYSENRFVLDEEAFMREIELPAFLEDPSQDYLKACELTPILEILQGHMR